MHRTVRLIAPCLSGLAALGLCSALAQDATVEVVSSPPHLVTGQDVLIMVTGTDLNPIGWASNTTLPTPFFQDESGDWFGHIGLRDHLVPGENIIGVVPNIADLSHQVSFTIIVHDPKEPLFDGPRPEPAACQNEEFGLKPAAEETCAAPRIVTYIYRTVDGTWAPFRRDGARPVDIALTKTSAGQEVPMIVRVETGVINRAPYAISLLHDPAVGSAPSPGGRQPSAWNGTLAYGAGDGFALGNPAAGRVGFFDLGSVRAGGAATTCPDALIGQGYAIAAAQTVIGPMIHDIVAAETMLRVKEWFIKRHGLPDATIGLGTAEAGPALTRIADTYPGLGSAIDPADGPARASLGEAARSCP